VAYCEPKVFAKLQSDSIIKGSGFVINSCGNQTIDFVNLSTDENFISSYKWSFNIQGMEEIIITKNAKITFPDTGTYIGKMILNEGTSCADSADIRVTIFPGLNADFNFTYDTCIAGPVQFTDLSTSGSGLVTNWNWKFANNGNSTQSNPAFLFNTPGNKQVSLEITDLNKCKDIITKNLVYYPVPPLIIVDPGRVQGCTPLRVCFNNLSVPIDTTYTIHWDFGDGTSGTKISPCHTYSEEGIYSVKLEITSPIGCYTEKLYPNLVNTSLSPEAIFDYSPDQLTSLKPTTSFSDNSNFASSREWIFNDQDRFIIPRLDYTFQDTGLQKVTLIAISSNGCRDTLIKYIDVEPRVTFFMPNAFTPNGDSRNDLFKGSGIVKDMKFFEMTIWDRWGMQLFKTHDPQEGWNGKLENKGVDLPNGVYVYKVNYITPRDKLLEISGFATLIR
jgi:gliding motility-associated-like protein